MEIINVGFPISVISWAHRVHDQNVLCSEFLAVGICSVDFSSSADDLAKLTLETLDLNYLQMTNNSKKESGHVLIYKIVVNASTKNLEKTLLCAFFSFLDFFLKFFFGKFLSRIFFLRQFFNYFFGKGYTIQINHGGVLDLKWSPKPSNDKHGTFFVHKIYIINK